MGAPLGIWASEANIAILREGFAAGESFAEIARRIGHGCTRNAAIGKSKRLGMVRDHLVGLVNNARTKTNEARGLPPPRAPDVARRPHQNGGLAFGNRKPPVMVEIVCQSDLSPTATLETLTSRACKWPIGDPRSPSFGFCGRLKGLEESYCPHHKAVAYRGLPAVRSEAHQEADVRRRAAMLRRRAA